MANEWCPNPNGAITTNPSRKCFMPLLLFPWRSCQIFGALLVARIAIEFPGLRSFWSPIVAEFVGMRFREHLGVFPSERHRQTLAAGQKTVAFNQMRIGSAPASAGDSSDSFARKPHSVYRQDVTFPMPDGMPIRDGIERVRIHVPPAVRVDVPRRV